jgi:ADP-heptose:LPS heptosyltransferase
MPGQDSATRAPSSVLIVRLGAVGDVIRSLPALEALRRLAPDARIGWAVEPGAASLLDGQPSLDRLHVVPRGVGGRARRAWRELREARYDTVLDLHGILRSAILARLTGAPNRLAYGPPVGRERSHWLATRTVPSPQEPWRVAHFLGLVVALGMGEVEETPAVTIPVRPEERERVDGWLRELHEPGRPLVALHPGASRGAGWKRWPVERFRLVGERLAAMHDATVVATWGPGEEELVRELAGGATHPARVPPLLNLRELAELYRRADLFVGGDTGPMHLAAAVGTGVVCLMGGSDGARNRPMGEGHVVLAAGPPLRPRPWNRVRLRERVLAISANDVYEEAARRLEGAE